MQSRPQGGYLAGVSMALPPTAQDADSTVRDGASIGAGTGTSTNIGTTSQSHRTRQSTSRNRLNTHAADRQENASATTHASPNTNTNTKSRANSSSSITDTNTNTNSNSNSTSDDRESQRTQTDDTPPLRNGIQTSCFWLAIFLPLGHIPLLATGLSSGLETAIFFMLLGLNVLALYVGHSHRS